MNQTEEKIISTNEEEFSSNSVATSNSSMRYLATPTNTSKVKFKHHKRKSWIFLNTRLNVAMPQKNTPTTAGTR